MNTIYSLDDLQLRKQLIIAKKLVVEEKKKEHTIIIPGKEEKSSEFIDDYSDHPLQAEVLAFGSGIEEAFPKGIEKGDIIYLSTFSPGDIVNIQGTLYIKTFASNVFMIRKPIKELEVLKKKIPKNAN